MDRATTAKIIYWLYLAGLFFGVPILIAVAWAYVEKEKNISDLQHSHFDQQFLSRSDFGSAAIASDRLRDRYPNKKIAINKIATIATKERIVEKIAAIIGLSK